MYADVLKAKVINYAFFLFVVPVIALKSNSSIRELRLGDNNLSSSDAVQLASLLRYNTNIQLLDLSNNQIQVSSGRDAVTLGQLQHLCQQIWAGDGSGSSETLRSGIRSVSVRCCTKMRLECPL